MLEERQTHHALIPSKVTHCNPFLALLYRDSMGFLQMLSMVVA